MLGVVPAVAAAQGPDGPIELGGQTIVVYRRHDPVPGSRALDELRVVQPVLRLRGAAVGGRVVVHALANFEGATMPNGELTLGAWGEGFVDRRHPHTYLHELVLTAAGKGGPVRGSLSVGKAFVPFGTDDPMTRPVLSYPVNHHLSQVLERAAVIAALAAGPAVLEAALFNGDEPDAPDAWPRIARFGDSWALRLTLRPAGRWDAQVSYADVRSPEHRGGAGLDHAKWSASIRRGEFLAEWARTSEGSGAFVFRSILLEGGRAIGRHHAYLRFERTERPEEERVAGFRSRRPLRDNSILGTSRWTLWTAGYRYRVSEPWRTVVEPFLEAGVGRVTAVGGGIFDPEVYYGGRSFASAALGVRLSVAMDGHRMGRYGVAASVPEEH